jgi:hypothetical protein
MTPALLLLVLAGSATLELSVGAPKVVATRSTTIPPDGRSISYPVTYGWHVACDKLARGAYRWVRIGGWSGGMTPLASNDTAGTATQDFEPGAVLPGRMLVIGCNGLPASSCRDAGWCVESRVVVLPPNLIGASLLVGDPFALYKCFKIGRPVSPPSWWRRA